MLAPDLIVDHAPQREPAAQAVPAMAGTKTPVIRRGYLEFNFHIYIR
jgi:hypothetical protein